MVRFSLSLEFSTYFYRTKQINFLFVGFPALKYKIQPGDFSKENPLFYVKTKISFQKSSLHVLLGPVPREYMRHAFNSISFCVESIYIFSKPKDIRFQVKINL
jgi:hypothetical protein